MTANFNNNPTILHFAIIFTASFSSASDIFIAASFDLEVCI